MSETNETARTCTKCGLSKPLEEFARVSYYQSTQCKQCTRERNNARDNKRRRKQKERGWIFK